MTIKELIEYLKTLDQDARVFLQYNSFDWYELQQTDIEHPTEHDMDYSQSKRLGVKLTDYKIEL